MMDIDAERLITLADAARIIPPARRGRKTAISTLWRWVEKGALAPTGERVHLEAVRAPRGYLTSREAVYRFLERLTPEHARSAARDLPRSATRRRRASERAGRELEKLGI